MLDDNSVLTLEQLMAMRGPELHGVLLRGHPLDPDVLAGRQYQGVDLSLPGFMRKLLWHTFRKTFVRDPERGDVRGWNVRMEQHGVHGPAIAMKTRAGAPLTFGHYRVRERGTRRFPKGYAGTHYLDYTVAGNGWFDPARFARAPLVAVNAGSQDLLLGWEVFEFGPLCVYPPLYWALRYEGPVDFVADPPCPPRA